MRMSDLEYLGAIQFTAVLTAAAPAMLVLPAWVLSAVVRPGAAPAESGPTPNGEGETQRRTLPFLPLPTREP